MGEPHVALAISANSINNGGTIIGIPPGVSQNYAGNADVITAISDVSGDYSSRMSGIRFYTGDTDN